MNISFYAQKSIIAYQGFIYRGTNLPINNEIARTHETGLAIVVLLLCSSIILYLVQGQVALDSIKGEKTKKKINSIARLFLTIVKTISKDTLLNSAYILILISSIGYFSCNFCAGVLRIFYPNLIIIEEVIILTSFLLLLLTVASTTILILYKDIYKGIDINRKTQLLTTIIPQIIFTPFLLFSFLILVVSIKVPALIYPSGLILVSSLAYLLSKPKSKSAFILKIQVLLMTITTLSTILVYYLLIEGSTIDTLLERGVPINFLVLISMLITTVIAHRKFIDLYHKLTISR